MTFCAESDFAATNVDLIMVFVAAIRAVIPEKNTEDPFPGNKKADHDVLNQEMGEADIRDINSGADINNPEIKSGKQLWAWVVSTNISAASLASRLTEGQKNDAQRVLEGMFQEFFEPT